MMGRLSGESGQIENRVRQLEQLLARWLSGQFGSLPASSIDGVVAPANGGTGRTDGATLRVQEIDGVPDVFGVLILRVPNGSLTNDGGGQVTVQGFLEVKEVDGAPDVVAVRTVVVRNGMLQNDGAGQVTFLNIRSLKATGQPALIDDVELAAGTRMTLSQAGQVITLQPNPQDASIITYTPADLGDWDGVDPGEVDEALDSLADRVGAAENALHVHALYRLVADGVASTFDMPDIFVADTVVVYDDGAIVDPVNVTESADHTQVTLSAAPGAASIMVFQYEVKTL